MDVRNPRNRFLAGVAITVMVATAGTAAAQSQTQTQTSPPPASAPAPGRATPAPDPAAREKSVQEVTGKVKKVDAVGKKVEVSSGLFGLLGRTLEVTEDTQIRHEGRQEQLTALREGARVRAEYEARDGKNIAKSIEVMPEPERPAAGGQGAAPRKTTP